MVQNSLINPYERVLTQIVYRKPGEKIEADGKGKKPEKKKRRRRKNPCAPKQPMSAYNHFVREKVDYYKSFWADQKHQIIMKEVSTAWKNLADKSKYI